LSLSHLPFPTMDIYQSAYHLDNSTLLGIHWQAKTVIQLHTFGCRLHTAKSTAIMPGQPTSEEQSIAHRHTRGNVPHPSHRHRCGLRASRRKIFTRYLDFLSMESSLSSLLHCFLPLVPLDSRHSKSKFYTQSGSCSIEIEVLECNTTTLL